MRIKAALLAMGLVSCGLAQAALTSGTYVTEGKGNNCLLYTSPSPRD